MTIGRVRLDQTLWLAELQRDAQELGIVLDEGSSLLMVGHLAEVFAENARAGLTSIEDPVEAIDKHILDSLSVLKACTLVPGLSMADIGSGAGYPGLPLHIAVGSGRTVLIEASRRKADFLEATVERLGLTGVEVLWQRAEQVGQDMSWREGMDLVVSRAVAELRILVELSLPLLKDGGRFVALKGPDVGDEAERALTALEAVGGRIERTMRLALPHARGDRTLIIIEKTQATDKRYPRRPGIPEKRPL